LGKGEGGAEGGRRGEVGEKSAGREGGGNGEGNIW